MIVESLKRCSECRQELPLREFYPNRNGRFGVHSVCRACSRKYCARKRANRLRLGDDHIPSEKQCSMCGLVLPADQFGRSRATANGLKSWCRDCTSVAARGGKYSLPESQVRRMLAQSQCEACGCSLAANSEKYIDHRHSDGAVRGVLCNRCNTSVGACEENPEILRAIAGYIERTAENDYRTSPYGVTVDEVCGQ